MTKRHPGQRRLSREHQEHEDDIFVAKILEISNWLRSNQQAVTVLVVILVLGVAAGLYYFNYRKSLVTQAANQLEQIHQTVALQDREGAKQQLKVFLDRFGGTPYAGEARMLLGELYLDGNDPQQAQAVLEPIAQSPRDPLELQAASLLAAAYEQEKRWSDAEATYLRIADRSELDFQIRDALASAARIRAQEGNRQGAEELYQRILDGLDQNDPQRGLYEMRIAELKDRVASKD
ncbi:MAG: tetratricopeptide repeat protein [Gemmatimonadota bacterium]|jgi:predicted negative regulator of RcsB-dependent stress response